MRIEKDFLGERELPSEALYGIHSLRASENFPYRSEFHIEWFMALGLTKLACYNTYTSFLKAAVNKTGHSSLPFTPLNKEVVEMMKQAAMEIAAGNHFDQFIVPAVQGGAGTSINMNINEIIANATLIKLNSHTGNYKLADPIEHANIYQSTNDVVPTSLRLAVIKLLLVLEEEINQLRFIIEKTESIHRNHLRIAYTQMQQAVPSSWGMLLGSYNEALSRDWWRVSKCFERIKTVNLGGSAAGTGLAVPRYFIMEVVQELRKLTGLPLSRSENLPDATSNHDGLVEVHAILKTYAVNLEKMVSDLRLLSSDIAGGNELTLPKVQVGSSIMPGKVNPVICEYVISCSHKIYANDQIITSLSGQGCLDLNAYLPSIGHALLESIKLLIASSRSLRINLFSRITVNNKVSELNLFSSPAITTALTPYIGYNKSAILAGLMKEKGLDIFKANEEMQVIDPDWLAAILEPENLLKTGFSLGDLHNRRQKDPD
jgi:aspartate ammonia-lyase